MTFTSLFQTGGPLLSKQPGRLQLAGEGKAAMAGNYWNSRTANARAGLLSFGSAEKVSLVIPRPPFRGAACFWLAEMLGSHFPLLPHRQRAAVANGWHNFALAAPPFTTALVQQPEPSGLILMMCPKRENIRSNKSTRLELTLPWKALSGAEASEGL